MRVQLSIAGRVRLPALLSFVLLLPLFALLVTHASAADPPASASYDDLRKLTSSNFTLTGQGAWFVEFYSPYCKHCRAFGPTWAELAHNKESLRTDYPDAPFSLAQVNCVSQRDLCTKNNIEFLPTLALFYDGVEQKNAYQGNRDYADLSAFVDDHASEYRTKKGVVAPAAPVPAPAPAAPSPVVVPPVQPVAPQPVKEVAPEKPVAPVPVPAPAPPAEKPGAAPVPQAAPVAAAPAGENTVIPPSPNDPRPDGPNPKGELISYGSSLIPTPEDLERWLQKGSGQGPSFVKFFAPWCPHCRAMANAFKELAHSLKDRVNVIEVNCEEYKLLCSQYRITGYPTLRMYNDGEMTQYDGGRNHDAMLRWAVKAGSTMGLKTIENGGDLDMVAKAEEVFYLYLHSPGTPDAEIAAVDAASRVAGTTRAQSYISTDPGLLFRFSEHLSERQSASGIKSTSGLLVFKDHSDMRPLNVYYPTSNSTETAAWMARQRFPLVTELTGGNFREIVENDVGARVVLAALSDVHHGGASLPSDVGTARRDEEVKALRTAALSWREHETDQPIIWAWIDADRWSSQLRKHYRVRSDQLPALLLLDSAQNQFFELPSTPWLDRTAVIRSITAALQGTLLPQQTGSPLFRSAVQTIVTSCASHPKSSSLFVFAVLVALVLYVRKTGSGAGPTLPVYAKASTVKSD